MASDDDVLLPDLQVIQRYSLAVRGATAPHADVVAALQADLDWLTGGGRRRPAAASSSASVKAPKPAPAAAKPAAAKPVASKAAPAKKAAKSTPSKKSGARRA